MWHGLHFTLNGKALLLWMEMTLVYSCTLDVATWPLSFSSSVTIITSEIITAVLFNKSQSYFCILCHHNKSLKNLFLLTLINSVAFQPMPRYQSYHYTRPQNYQYSYCNCGVRVKSVDLSNVWLFHKKFLIPSCVSFNLLMCTHNAAWMNILPSFVSASPSPSTFLFSIFKPIIFHVEKRLHPCCFLLYWWCR